jgi:hypothetical protein
VQLYEGRWVRCWRATTILAQTSHSVVPFDKIILPYLLLAGFTGQLMPNAKFRRVRQRPAYAPSCDASISQGYTVCTPFKQRGADDAAWLLWRDVWVGRPIQVQRLQHSQHSRSNCGLKMWTHSSGCFSEKQLLRAARGVRGWCMCAGVQNLNK